MFFRFTALIMIPYFFVFAISFNWGESIVIDNTIPAPRASVIGLVASDDGERAICLYKDAGINTFYSSHSINHGAAWTRSPLNFVSLDGTVALNSDGSKALFAFANGAAISSRFSTDLGESWLYSGTVGIAASQSYSAINGDGSKAYLAWVEFPADIYFSISVDYGQTWAPPTLIGPGKNPSISTTEDGEKVFIAYSDLLTNLMTAYSPNHGNTWTVSAVGPAGNFPIIVNSSSGDHLFLAWFSSASHGSFVANSSDFGAHWTLPIVPLSGRSPSIASNGSGDTVVTLEREIAPPFTLSSAFTTDFATSWSAIHETTPQSGLTCKIMINKLATRLLRAWSNTSQDTIYSSVGDSFSLTPRGRQIVKEFLLQIDVVNEIMWNTSPLAASYRVYADPALLTLLHQGSENTFFQHGMVLGERRTYYVTWLDSLGNESLPVSVTVP